jgi:hypothetical protein
MKLITKMTALLMMLGFAAGLAHAQAGTTGIKVNIPFRFVIGRTTYSPGQYSILSTREKVWVQDASGRNATVMFARAIDGEVPERDGRVIFNCYSGACFLSQVWIAGTEAGRRLPESKREMELAKLGPGQQFALMGTKQGR